MYIFGKRTDRDARIEYTVLRDEKFDAAQQALNDFAADLINGSPTEEVNGRIPKVSAALTWRWRFPDETPAEKRRDLLKQQRRNVMLHRWPELTLKSLNGKTPREAAALPELKIAALACLLLLEIGNEQSGNEFDFNELRRELSLPTRDTIDPADIDPMRMSIVQVPQIDVAKLSDEDLLTLYRRVVLKNASESIRHLAKAVLDRGSLNDKVDKNETYDLLIRTATDAEDALSYVADAKKKATDAEESPARWLLAELSIRLSRGEAMECQKLVQTIQTRYMQEPGVSQGLYEILVSYGIISPEAMPPGAMPPGGMPPGAGPGAQMAAPAPAAQAWTPDAPAAAAPAAEKSKLWVPGMD